jgi:hypothetical protein
LPDPLLEGAAAEIEQEVERAPGGFDQPNHLGQVLSQFLIPPEQRGSGKPIFQLAGNGLRIVAQENGADASVSPGYQDEAHRTMADRIVELGWLSSDGWSVH